MWKMLKWSCLKWIKLYIISNIYLLVHDSGIQHETLEQSVLSSLGHMWNYLSVRCRSVVNDTITLLVWIAKKLFLLVVIKLWFTSASMGGTFMMQCGKITNVKPV